MPRLDLITDIAAAPDLCFDVSLDVQVHLAASRTQRIVGGVCSGRMRLGEHVTWSARHFGVRWRMTSKIVEYDRSRTFTDAMQRGPFGRWRHQHLFEKTATGTRMVDHVAFASPFGPIGRIVDALVLERYMTNLLREHNAHVKAVAEGTLAMPTIPRPADPSGLHDSGSASVHIAGIGTTIICCKPRAVMEFVLDVERYRQADHKIGQLHYMRRVGNRGRLRHGGRFIGIPAPAATLDFELTPFSRLEFRGVRMPWPLRGFHGSFICTPTSAGTDVTHEECFVFGPLTGRMLRPFLGRWLARDTQAEVIRMKHQLERAESLAA